MIAKPMLRTTQTMITIIMKTITSPRFLTIKSNDLFVLSIASVPSIIAIVIMNKATGIRTNVVMQTAEIMAARIKMRI